MKKVMIDLETTGVVEMDSLFVARQLERTAKEIRDGRTSGAVRDEGGNIIGCWDMDWGVPEK